MPRKGRKRDVSRSLFVQSFKLLLDGVSPESSTLDVITNVGYVPAQAGFAQSDDVRTCAIQRVWLSC